MLILATATGPVDTPRHVWHAPASIQQPPAKYALAKQGPTTVVYADDAGKKCRQLLSASILPHEVYGCAVLKGKQCLIVLQSGMPPDLESAVLSHEAGHCKGWPASHPLK